MANCFICVVCVVMSHLVLPDLSLSRILSPCMGYRGLDRESRLGVLGVAKSRLSELSTASVSLVYLERTSIWRGRCFTFIFLVLDRTSINTKRNKSTKIVSFYFLAYEASFFFFSFGLVPSLFWTALFASWGSVGFPSVLCQEEQCRFR